MIYKGSSDEFFCRSCNISIWLKGANSNAVKRPGYFLDYFSGEWGEFEDLDSSELVINGDVSDYGFSKRKAGHKTTTTIKPLRKLIYRKHG
jgi:hypothetical protein